MVTDTHQSGVVPLLDTFWDRPRGHLGATSSRVLVTPFLSNLALSNDEQHLSLLKEDDIVLFLSNMLQCLMVLHEERHVIMEPSKKFHSPFQPDCTANLRSCWLLG